MEGPVTWQLLGLIAVIVSGALGLWARVESAIRTSKAELEASVDARGAEIIVLQKSFMDYKVHAAERYATFDHIKDVEMRLTTAIERLTNRVEALPRQFAEELRGFNRGEE